MINELTSTEGRVKESSVQKILETLVAESNPHIILESLAFVCMVKATNIRQFHRNDELADKYANVSVAISDIMQTVREQEF